MALAKALLEEGEREVVLAYFELCRAFWQLGDEKLAYWTAVIRRGEIPNFRAHLDY